MYKVTVSCKAEAEHYSNSENSLNHSFENGTCAHCGVIEMDYNGDGKLNVLDLVRLKKHLADKTVEIEDTVDDDTVIEAADLVKLRKRLLNN